MKEQDFFDENVKDDDLPQEVDFGREEQEVDINKKVQDLEIELEIDKPEGVKKELESRNSINPGHKHLPVTKTLTDAASVTLEVDNANVFELTAGGDRTILAPTTITGKSFWNNQMILIKHFASGANRTLTLTTGSAGAFRFGTTVAALSATSSGVWDYILCIYNESDARWDVISVVKGY